MKAEVKIPKGFRRLRRGEEVKKGCGGDYWFDRSDMTWNEYGLYDFYSETDTPIRRIQRAKPVKKSRKP